MIGETLGSLLTSLIPGLQMEGRGTDRRLLKADSVRCGIRATSGRVLNIGTEWSSGVCVISPSRLAFTPSMGIVGDREIEVLALRRAEKAVPITTPWVGLTLIITTAQGELYLSIPEHVAEEVLARLEVQLEVLE